MDDGINIVSPCTYAWDGAIPSQKINLFLLFVLEMWWVGDGGEA